MTVPTTTTVATYQGNGSTTIFTFSFIADQPSDINVYLTDTNGTRTLVPTNQYALQINAVPVGGLWGLGGTVTYPLSGGTALQVGNYITIERDVPYTQDISIGNQGAFYPQAVEQALDVLELQIQQLNTDYLYAFKAPVTDPVPPRDLPGFAARANGYFAFDANGQPIITTAPGVTPTPGSYATPRKISTTGTATLNVLTTDSFGGVSIYQSSTPVTTVQLPIGYGPFPVFDGSLNSGTYPITVLPPAGKTILGQTQFIIAFNGQSVTFFNDGTQILIG